MANLLTTMARPAPSWPTTLQYKGGVNVAVSRLSSANVGQSGEIIVAPASNANPLLPVEVFKSPTNTGEVAMGDAPIATFSFFQVGLFKDSFLSLSAVMESER